MNISRGIDSVLFGCMAQDSDADIGGFLNHRS